LPIFTSVIYQEYQKGSCAGIMKRIRRLISNPFTIYRKSIANLKSIVVSFRYLSLLFVCYSFFGATWSLGQAGANDPSFNTNISSPLYVEAIVVQPDGKIVIGGGFGGTIGKVVRLNANGSVDATFNEGTALGLNSFVRAIALQSDGKIIVGGSFTTFNGVSKGCIVRLNSNGTIDPTFNTGIGTESTVYDLAIQNDGKIIIAGGFLTYNGVSSNQIARLNMDGTLDPSFTIGTGAEGNATETNSVALQPDGKIIIGGNFKTYNGITRNGIVRLNPDGTLDNSFVTGTGANDGAIQTISIQSDGSILLGGSFTTFNNVACNSMIKVDQNGAIDNQFITNTLSWPDFMPLHTALQSDGKILIGGIGKTADSPRISRLNADGTRDFSFNSCGIGANDKVAAIKILPDNKILIGGYFTAFNNQPKQYITKVLNNTAPCQIEASITLKSNGAEPGTWLVFDVTLSQVNTTGSDIIVNYSFTGGSAMAGSDYDIVTNSMFIPNGQSSAIISVPVNDDNLFEVTEDVEVTLQSASGGVVIASGALSKATATITDDELMVSLLGVANAFESDAAMLFFFSLSGINHTGEDIVANFTFTKTGSGPYATGGSTNAAGIDYNNSTTTVIIPNGQTTATLAIPIFNDLLIEGTEVIEITLESAGTPSGIRIATNSVKTAAGDLRDDDPGNVIRILSSQNGREGGNNVQFVITAPAPSVTPITVNFTYSGGTATGGSDYTNSTHSVVIPANQTNVTLEIPVVDDAISEITESVEITLTAASGSYPIANDGSQVKTAQIADNDIDLTKTTVTADKSRMFANDVETCTITVQLFDASGNPLTYATGSVVNLFTTRGRLGTVTDQGNGTYTCTLTAGLVAGDAVITCLVDGTPITDDATVELFSIYASIAPLSNGAEPSTPAKFEVSLSEVNITGLDIIVYFSYSGGSAYIGTDYDNSVTSVIIPNGQSKAILNVPVIDDTISEGIEDIEIVLQSSTSVILIAPGASGRAKASIIDNDALTVSLVGASNANESDPAMLFSLSLNDINSTSEFINVTYAFTTTGPGPYATGGTTNSGGFDYNNSITTVSIPPGDSKATIEVPIFNDVLIEGTEVIEVKIVSAATVSGRNILIGSNNIAAADLLDDEFNIIRIASSTDGKEGGNNAKYTINSSVTLSSPITVNFAYSGGTATAGSDFNNSITSIVIPANQSSIVLEVPVIDDVVSELTESLEVTLTSASGNNRIATDGTQKKLVLIEDNDPDLTKVTVTSDKSQLLANGTETCTITVKLFDASGNPLTNAAGSVVNLFTTLGSLGTVTDQGNGTYTCPFTAGLVAGDALITCKVNGNLVTDDATVKLFTIDASIALLSNGAEPSTPIQFEVTLSQVNTTGSNITLNYGFTGGSAIGGSDYNNSVTSVIIPNGQSKAIISIPVLDDNLFEVTEDVEVTLQSATAGVIIATGASAKAKASIMDNEALIVSLVGASNANESDPSISFSLSLNNPNIMGENIIVTYSFTATGPGPYATGGTTNAAGIDYNNSITSVVIPPGQSTATIAVPIFNDVLIEGTEVIEIKILSAVTTSGKIITVSSNNIAAGNLLDDDFNTIRISSSRDGKEGGNNVKYTITSSAASNSPITVNLTYSGGTATPGSDFNNSITSIVIPANQSSIILEVPVIDDAVSELTESLEVTLTSANGNNKIATDGTQKKSALIEDNDPDLTKVTVTSDKSQLLANGIETCTITVKLFDASGNPLTNAAGSVVNLFTTLGSLGTVTDQGNGTYTCLFTAGVVSGDALITCKLNGALVNDDATIKLIPITSNTNFVVNEGISPNGDGENDVWFIKGIENYPNNSIKIFNRWGSTVWFTSGYNNTTNCWRGDVKSDLTGLGSELPDGTYYYLIDLGDGKGAKSGFVILNR